MSRVLSRVLFGALPLLAASLCSIRPDDDPGGGGGGDGNSTAPEEPAVLDPAAAAATQPPGDPSKSDSDPGKTDGDPPRHFTLALFDSERARPELEICFSDELAAQIGRLVIEGSEGALGHLLRRMGLPGAAPLAPREPKPLTREQLAQHAKDDARRMIISQSAHTISAEAARLRAQGTITGDAGTLKQADEVEGRLAELIASVPPVPVGYYGHSLVCR